MKSYKTVQIMKILNYSKFKKHKFKMYFKCIVSYFRQDPLITQLHLLQTSCQITKKNHWRQWSLFSQQKL